MRASSIPCKHILIVEDEEIIRESLAELLRLEGYSVYVSRDGEEGLRTLKFMPRPSLILLDLMMPVMNGLEFLEAKGRDDAIAAIPVCICSAKTERPDAAGSSAYIKKPYALEDLLVIVQKFCGHES